MNVIVLGKPKYNVILPVDSYLKENEKRVIRERIEVSAGASIYVACMLAKWGIKVYYSGCICADDAGNKMKEELEKYGVDTKYVEPNYEKKSSINYVVLNKTNGSSTEILHENDANLTRFKYDILPDYIITDGSDMGGAIAAINNYPMAKIIFLANKPNEEFISLSKKAAYVCANMSFASALTKMDFNFNKPKTLVDLFQKIKDLNKAEYILMLRDKGTLYTSERQVKMIPAVTIEKKDDANSGSAFFGAYAYGILNNLGSDTTAKIANLSGALALTKVGSIATIPEKEEVFKLAGLKLEETTNEETQVQDELPKTANEVKEEPAKENPEVKEEVNEQLPKEMPEVKKEETTNETLG